jgi:8-oxo-dGTP diphosphatase
MPYSPILATLGYVMSPDSDAVLMIHRNTRTDDQHYGKYNGLGGKLESHEHIVHGMQREIYEEAGIEVLDLVLRGSINWPGFGKHGEDWLGFIFRIDRWQGTPLTHNAEGSLEWVKLERLPALNMWPGDRFFLPLVFSDDPRQFHGVMPYHNEQPTDWHYVWI